MLFTLLAIPLAIVVFAIVGTWGTYFVFIVSLFVPASAAFLYRAGSGGRLEKGRPQFILVSIVAVVIGVATGIVATAFGRFSAVGGDGGLFGSVFQSTLLRSLGTEEFLAQALVGLGLGIAGVFGALRSAKTLQDAATAPVIATDLPAGTAAPGTPIAPPAVTPPIAKPSPGIILNGEPLDPDALK
jgi:hypothetical protein